MVKSVGDGKEEIASKVDGIRFEHVAVADEGEGEGEDSLLGVGGRRFELRVLRFDARDRRSKCLRLSLEESERETNCLRELSLADRKRSIAYIISVSCWFVKGTDKSSTHDSTQASVTPVPLGLGAETGGASNTHSTPAALHLLQGFLSGPSHFICSTVRMPREKRLEDSIGRFNLLLT